MLYFSYGSNMSIKRMVARVRSAKKISTGVLTNHRLLFHKISIDRSGKCDAYRTNNSEDIVYGVLYSLDQSEIEKLDRAEGLGSGYDKKEIEIEGTDGELVNSFTYLATNIDKILIPFSWYKYHVLHGAVENKLPINYITYIDSFDSKTDPRSSKVEEELSIYQ